MNKIQRSRGRKTRAVIPLLFLFLLTALIVRTAKDNLAGATGRDASAPTPTEASCVLSEGEDRGQAYIDGMIFVGESTTAHLRSRGVLTGGKKTAQVWADDSNTMTLDLNILQKTIRYPETGEEMTIVQAAAEKRPTCMVISFGINGLLAFAGRPALYETSYVKLIEAIKAASPETTLLLQTVYPLGRAQRAFSEDTATLNRYIDGLNRQLPDIAAKTGAYVVDTATCLRDDEGYLRDEYQTDGIHLTSEAYEAILHCLRTHGYPEAEQCGDGRQCA